MRVGSTPLISVDTNPAHMLNRFTPSSMFGAGLDSVGGGGLLSDFSASNVQKMLGIGFGSISYRLYTELSVQDWHWNPTGTFSVGTEGYFQGSSNLGSSISETFGFALPHRGSTFDQGDNLDYSRLTDGDLTTYWKSNPYLASAFTGESDSLHPQWIVVDLGSINPVNAVQVAWANPYAVDYRVQYWTGPDAIGDPTNGAWADFPSGVVTGAKGGNVTLTVSSAPVNAEFVRVLMTQSSGTADSHGSGDQRNSLGYAVYEIGVGTVDPDGTFNDDVTHSSSQSQNATYVSSVDPWHQASGLVSANEQPGLDFILGGPLARKLPALVPVAMLYSTPDDANAEVGYLMARGYPLKGIELGEEPDGQYIEPEDYGALYIQFAKRIHKNWPNLMLGGPALSNSGGVQAWPNSAGEPDWLKRFVSYLQTHGALNQLAFVSEEHYPFTDASATQSELQTEPAQVQALFDELSFAGAPKSVPVYVDEVNMNAGISEGPEDELGALWHATFQAEFMSRGGAAAYYYQYLPTPLQANGATWGATAPFTADGSSQADGPTSQYFSAQMMSTEWCQRTGGIHLLLATQSNIKDSNGNLLVRAYSVLRPDHKFSVMLINTDSIAHSTRISFSGGITHAFLGIVRESVFADSTYKWLANGSNGHAGPAGPYSSFSALVRSARSVNLPPHSLVILTGRVL